MAFRWRADGGPKLNARPSLFFQGSRTSIAKKPYNFVIQGGADPLPPSGSTNALPHGAVGCSKVYDCGSSCFRMLKGDVLMMPKSPSPDTQSNGDHSKQTTVVNWKKLNVKSTYVCIQST